MRKIFVSIFIFFLHTAVSAQQNKLAGTWLGALDIGVQLRLVFHINVDSSGHYTTTMDSPDQGVKGIPTSKTLVVNDSLLVEVEAIKGKFEGAIVNDSTINGHWTQGPATMAIAIKRVTEVPALRRPQTPKPPFNYRLEDVSIDNADKSVHLEGTLTKPLAGGPFATIVLITGSGTQDRDETISEHKPFAIIADHLTKQGYAVLRLDDRGAGKSTAKNLTNTTTKDLADDIAMAVAYLKKRPDVNAKKIGLLGHSEGGLIASMLAATNPDINYIVLLAAPGTKGSVLLADQAVAILKSSGVSAKAANAYRPLYLQFINAAINTSDTAAAFAKAWAAYQSWKKASPEEVVDELRLTYNDETAAMIKSLLPQFASSWMKYFLQTDPAKYLQQTKAKVLALNGSKDLQVLAKQNLAGIKAALQKSKSPLYEVKELPGLNHLFQVCDTCTVQEYGILENSFSPAALNVISNWLNRNIR